MSAIPEHVMSRLRAFAAEPPESAEEINEALDCVRTVCPDFAYSAEGTPKSATLTLRGGVRKELAAVTVGELMADAASMITGRSRGQRDSDK